MSLKDSSVSTHGSVASSDSDVSAMEMLVAQELATPHPYIRPNMVTFMQTMIALHHRQTSYDKA